jgi:hypothetical protein
MTRKPVVTAGSSGEPAATELSHCVEETQVVGGAETERVAPTKFCTA